MIGQTLGHYRIIEQIGAGGMGVVYRAKDERLDRDVALKVLPAGTLADEAVRKRFRIEALALSKVNHPNIATVYEFDTQAGVDFLVMEYVAGTTVAEKVAGGALPAKEVSALGVQVAAALEEAHERGVVHRDLKPGNILVTPKGRAKVLDFGLARLLRPPSEATIESLTESHAAVGTLPYMAPEQLRGEATDARTDIYAAGAVLYEMATGQRPFPETQAPRLIDAILHQAPQPPSALNRRVSLALESIILKCLDKEPERRYQSAKELLVDLERLSAPVPLAAVSRRHILPRRWALAGVGTLLVLAVLLGLNVGSWRDRLLGRAGTPSIKSLAVLPLANLSGDRDQDYFAEGMTDTLISDLAKIHALRVVSRTSVMQYKNAKKQLPEIARELNVDAVVEGSVLRAGDRVRITAQLIGATPERHLWAKSYDGDLRNVLALHTEVARAIAEEIRITLTPQEKVVLASARAVNPEAHEAYLKGRYHLNKAASQQEIGVAIDEFQRALAKDPTYALAYAGLSDAYYALREYTRRPPGFMDNKARAAALKALELDETLAESHVSLANVYLWYDWDWQRVEKESRRAIELNPNSAAAYDVQGNNLLALGRYPEAVGALKRALVLDPLSLSIYYDAGWLYFQGRQYDQAIEQYRKALELEPNYALARAGLALAYAGKGQSSQAIAEARKGRQIADSPLIWAMLSGVYAVSGERGEAEKQLKELVEISKQRYVCPYEIATAYVGLGNKEEAFLWLEKAYRARSACMPFLKTEPRFDSVRSDPRFQDLLRRVGFPP